jgi:hypothetical protein
MRTEQLHELLYQVLETEQMGAEVYRLAARCALHPELRRGWTESLDRTERHERIVRAALGRLGLDPEAEPASRLVARHIGEALVDSIEMACESSDADAAQLVAAECVLLAATRGHAAWELIGRCAEHADGDLARALAEARAQVADDEALHLHHGTGWSRELWIEALGLPAALPPPECTD